MSEIKSEKAIKFLDDALINSGNIKGVVRLFCAHKAVIIAEQEAEERHAKELQELCKKAVDRAKVTMGAMVLDGYEPEDSCVKYMKELINEFKELINELITKKDK